MFSPKSLRIRWLCFFTGFLCIGLPEALPAAEIDALVERLPANATLALATENLAASCEAFQKTPLGAELCGPSFAPLVAELRKQDIGGPLHLRPWVGFDWPNLAKCESPAALASFPLADGNAGTVWLLMDRADRDVLYRSVNTYFLGKKWKAAQPKVAGATVVRYSPPAKADRTPVIWFDAPDCYGIATSLEAVEVLLKTEPKTSFAATKAGAALLGDKDAQDGGRYFVRPLALWKSVRMPAPGKKLRLTDPVLVAERLGLGGITSVAGAIVLDREAGEAWEVRGELVVPKPYPKALKLLAMIPGPAIPLPKWVAADAKSVALLRWDFVKGMEGVGHIFDEQADPGPDGEGLFQQILDELHADPEGPQVDLRVELFPRLGPEVIEVGQEIKIKGKIQEHWLHVANCKDVPKVRGVLQKFFEPDKAVESSRIGDDYHLWVAKGGASLFMAAEELEEDAVTIRAAAVGDDRFWLASDSGLLRNAIEAKIKGGAAKPLAETDDWKAFVAWSDARANERTALEAWSRPGSISDDYAAAIEPKPAKEDSLTTQMWLFLLFGTMERRADLPFKAAPPFKAWSGKLPPLGLVFSETDRGWSVIVGDAE